MRDLHIDSLKGFLIICVLWGHVGVLTTAVALADISLWQRFEDFINIGLPVNYFHMTLFFALSILFVKGFNYSFVKKRALLLLIPYVFWFLWPVRDALLIQPLPILENLAYGNWAHVVSVLWFLPACFTVNVIYALYRNYAKTPWAALFWLAWLVVFFLAEPIAANYHTYIPFGLDLAIYLFPFLFLVDTIYQRRAWFTSRPWWNVFGLLPIYAGSIWLINYVEPVKTYSAYAMRIDLAQFSVPFTIPGLLGMLALVSSILVTFLMIRPSRLLAYLGKYSLPIYLLHLTIFGKLMTLYNQTAIVSNPILFFLAVAAAFPIIVGIAILASKLLSKLSPYAKYIGMVE